MTNDRTERKNHFVKMSTDTRVGPGAYLTHQETSKGFIQTIPKAGMTSNGKKKRKKNRGSIRADYEEGDTTSEEGEPPGPGDYLTRHHTSTFG